MRNLSNWRYVALGDSSGVGVGAREGGGYVARLHARLRAAGYSAELLNLCSSGATSAEVARHQVRPAVEAVGEAPCLATLAVGGNDTWRGVPVRAFARHVEAVVEQLLGAGASLVLANVPDLSLAPVAALVPRELYDGRIERLNEALAKLSLRYRLPLVDLYGHSQQSLPGHPELFSEDGFHPSAQGYERWTDAMWPVVRAVASRLRSRGPAGAEALAEEEPSLPPT